MKSIIFYNLYPKNHWKELTLFLLSNVPHDTIVVNVTLDRWDRLFKKNAIKRFLQKIPKVSTIYYTDNSPYGEVPGFDKMRKNTDLSEYSVLTYMHSKGVTKTSIIYYINDWIKLMHYFLTDRFDLCKEAFKDKYVLYGVNLSIYDVDEKDNYGPSKFSRFHYSGNFVSVNLDMARERFVQTPIDMDYFGVEGFFGKLCEYNQAYNVHDTSDSMLLSHYFQPYPEENYKK